MVPEKNCGQTDTGANGQTTEDTSQDFVVGPKYTTLWQILKKT